MTTDTGSFSRAFAERRAHRRKLDENLLKAVLAIIPADKTIIDLGAGTGELVRALICEGRQASGIDGTPGVHELSRGVVVEADLTSYDDMEHVSPRDWATCFEVGEHIPEKHATALLTLISERATYGLMISWARIGQRGHGHINCHNPEWVACEFGYRGWVLDEPRTIEAREIAGDGWDKKLMVFRKRFPCSPT